MYNLSLTDWNWD